MAPLRTTVLSCNASNGTVPEILPHLHLGTQRESRNEENLIAQGITHLLCVADSFRFPNDPLLKYLHVPLSDEGSSDLQLVFQKCFQFIEESRISGGRTFLFCRQAQNRSPSITLAYLMSYCGKTLSESYELVQGIKSDISPHETYFEQLQALDQELFGKISMTQADRGGSVQDAIRRLRESES